ncbi:MAG: SpoIIE family protein phosphatase, partial [Verrucomicrobiales bacterium]|nr:SpoIIE family protein phosphatase [Verrucomicrobiales bacterium]
DPDSPADSGDDAMPPAPAAVPVVSASSDNHGLRILIAEDNDVTRMKLQADLEKWGHHVTAAEDGEQAWEYFQKYDFSIVLTDWMMPNVDGLELVKRIRATGRATYVYVIMLTAKAEKHDIVLGMGAGADDFLAKPYHRDELNVRIRAGKRIVDMTRAIGKTSRRIDRGIQAAARIQRSFLPEAAPEIPGLQFAWEYQPCDELGGDMLNIVNLDENHIGLYILDVNGTGVPASLLATNVSRFMASANDNASILVDRQGNPENPTIVEPERVAWKLNQQFSGNPETNQFFTLVYGILNRDTLEFCYTCAGHPPLFHQNGSGPPTALEGFGLPIGVMADNDDYHQESIQLQSGDRLFFYSNGVPNTPNAEDALFGRERLAASIEKNRETALAGVPPAIVSEIREFGDHSELKDDLTILAVEIE